MNAMISRRAILAAGLGSVAASTMALGQDAPFPSKPIRFIVNAPPGAGSDLAARFIADAVSSQLGQPVVVENRTGANGSIGSEALARAPKDGHVIGIANQSSVVVAPLLIPNISYKLEDFQLVTMLYRGGMVLAVRKDMPVNNLREFVEYVKRQGSLAYGSFGVASPARLTMELLASEAKINLTNVSYRGEGQIATDVLGGSLPAYVGAPLPVLQQHRSGEMKILAISLDQRSPGLSDIPTFREQGFQSVVYTWFHGIALPAGTPRAIVDKWNAILKPVIASEKFRASLTPDLVPTPNTPEEFTASAKNDREWIGKIIKDKNITPE